MVYNEQLRQDTARVLIDQFTTNTGRSLCDSGFYGYTWQANAQREFATEPYLHYKADEYGIELSINTYHALLDNLTYDFVVDDLFRRYADLYPDDYWLTLMERFPQVHALWVQVPGAVDHALSQDDSYELDTLLEVTELVHDIGGVYGDGDPETVNTYNYESYFDQILQYVFYTIDGDPFMLIQVHGGADVRGGYTSPRAYVPNEDEGIYALDDRAYLSCFVGRHTIEFGGGYISFDDMSGRDMTFMSYTDFKAEYRVNIAVNGLNNTLKHLWNKGIAVFSDGSNHWGNMPDGVIINPCRYKEYFS